MASFEFFGKKYKLDLRTSRNFEEYLKETGVKKSIRKFGSTVRPVVELKQELDGKLTFSSKSSFANVSVTFDLGKEFDEITLDGRKVKSIVTQDGNTFTQIQKNGKEAIIIREFGPKELKITMKAGKVVSTRIYKVQE